MKALLSTWFTRSRRGQRKSRADVELEHELATHVQLDVEAQTAQGVDPHEAKRQALMRLGGVVQVAEACRDSRSLTWLGPLAQDVRFACRQLLHHRGFTVAAVLTLGLGVGATSAMFSVVRGVLLTPLPYPEPARRVLLFTQWVAFDKTTLADQEIVDFRTRARTLASIAAWQTTRQNLTGDAEPLRIGVGLVSSNLFEVLGVRPALGRTFTSEEDRPHGPAVALLSDAVWRARYAADASIVGRTILLDELPVEVVGVMPPGFRLPTDLTEEIEEPSRLWRPLQMDEGNLSRGHSYSAAALLAPGQSVESATSELRTIAKQLTAEGAYPEPMHFSAFAVSMEDEIRGGVRPAVWLLAFGVVCLLLIACANVAHLLLVRGDSRSREMAVRAALGGGRGRLLRQLTTESAVLTTTALVVGWPLAWAGVHLLARLDSTHLPLLAPVHLDVAMVLLSLGLTTITTVAFGLVPALRVHRRSLVEALRLVSGQSFIGRRHAGVQDVLVVAEVCLAVVLLIGAGLMMRSLVALNRIDLGFEPSHVLTMRVTLPERRYRSPQEVVDFYRELSERTRTLPGAVAAGTVRLLPLATTIGDWGLDVDGYEEWPGHTAKGDWQVVSDGAFEAMGTRLVRGRWFTAADASESELVAVVNETLARTYWPHVDAAVGGRIRIGSSERPWVRVVGVVADERHNSVTGSAKEKFYVPQSQWHRARQGDPIRDAFLVVRTSGEPMALAGAVQGVLRTLDPNVPGTTPRAMTDVVAASLATPRFTGALLGTFAVVALTLAGVGIYGVLAYAVARRTRELGIRIALGARRAEVVRMVVTGGLRLAGIGVLLGLVVSLGLARVIRSLLFHVAPIDGVTFALVPLVLLVVAAAASAVPAIRAAWLDPLTALRTE